MQQYQTAVDAQVPAIRDMIASNQVAPEAPAEEPAAAQQPPAFLQTPEGTYSEFVKQMSSRVARCVPDTDLKFHHMKDQGIFVETLMYKVVSLPSNRTFVIGGSKDINSSETVKSTFEIVEGNLQPRASMWNARSSFGLAVYPNYSQIFIAGGKTGESVATKHCERYIVAQDTWKRLPELREAKFSTSLCFFNNGGTLYCFGGIITGPGGQLNPTASIERLSKGQNNWQLLELKLPTTNFDLGCLQTGANEVMVFGGFCEGAKKETFIYDVTSGDGSFKRGKDMETADFFEQNGVFITVPGRGEANRQIVFNGHQ